MKHVLGIGQVRAFGDAVVANLCPRQHNPRLPQRDLPRGHCRLVLPVNLHLICRHKTVALLHADISREEKGALSDFTVVG